MLQRVCLLLLTSLFFASSVHADELKTVNGKSVTGSLETITDKEIALKTDKGTVATPLSQALDLLLRPGNAVPAAGKYAEVVLYDDSLLYCSKVTFGAKELEMQLTTGATVKVPMTAFVSLLRDANDPDIKKQWTKLMKAKVRSDRIFVLNMGDINSLSGSFSEIDEKAGTVKFKKEGSNEPLDYKLEKLQGISLLRTDAPTEASLCKVIDLDGNVLVASKLSSDGKQLFVATPAGSKVTLEAATIARVDFNFGRLTYVSDLDVKLAETPFFGGFAIFRKDKNLDGSEIMLLDKQYPKGLSMYAGADMTYDLGGKYKEFKALLGADARIAEEGQGKVTVTIYCDNEKRFSALVPANGAQAVAINVKDIQTLRIVVSGTNFTNYSGHATLANAHVSQ